MRSGHFKNVISFILALNRNLFSKRDTKKKPKNNEGQYCGLFG